MTTVVKNKIMFKKLKNTDYIWHPESRLVFRSSTDKVVVGVMNDKNELRRLDKECINNCEKFNFKYDEKFVTKGTISTKVEVEVEEQDESDSEEQEQNEEESEEVEESKQQNDNKNEIDEETEETEETEEKIEVINKVNIEESDSDNMNTKDVDTKVEDESNNTIQSSNEVETIVTNLDDNLKLYMSTLKSDLLKYNSMLVTKYENDIKNLNLRLKNTEEELSNKVKELETTVNELEKMKQKFQGIKQLFAL